MNDVSAVQKHTCAACGAPAEWNAGKMRLVCPFCGTETPFEMKPATGQVEEIDLARTLRDLDDTQRGWKGEKKTVQCQSCKAVSVFDPDRVGQRCDFCGSPAIVDYNEIKAPISPQSLLPFRVAESSVRETIRKWYAGRWFAPNALSTKALVDTIKGIYIPYWTFDARVHCPWTAEAGHYYYETVRRNGKTERVQKIRWEPAAGVVDHFFDDTLVAGTRGVHESLLRKIEPFPTAELVPYDRAYLAGFVVEHYQVVLFDAAKAGADRMHEALLGLCAAQVPGDTQRNLRIDPQYSAQTFKHILVPIWMLVYNYRAKPYQLVVNGYTGAMDGEYPKSAWKIFFAVLAVIVIFLIIAWLDAN